MNKEHKKLLLKTSRLLEFEKIIVFNNIPYNDWINDKEAFDHYSKMLNNATSPYNHTDPREAFVSKTPTK